MRGTLARFEAAEDEDVRAGQVVAIVEAVKMEHEALAPEAGRIERLLAQPGAIVEAGEPLALLEPIAAEEVRLRRPLLSIQTTYAATSRSPSIAGED